MTDTAPDPLAEADLTVKKANAILAELMTASAALTARDLAVKDERKKLAYAAHGTKDPRSQKRLSELHREHAELHSEQLSLADAIDEARRVLAAAEENVRIEREKRRAREAIAMTEKMREHCVNCDRALVVFIQTYEQLDIVAARIAGMCGRHLSPPTCRRRSSIADGGAVHLSAGIPMWKTAPFLGRARVDGTHETRPLAEQRLDPDKDDRCCRERRQQCEARKLRPRRQARELDLDEFEIVRRSRTGRRGLDRSGAT